MLNNYPTVKRFFSVLVVHTCLFALVSHQNPGICFGQGATIIWRLFDSQEPEVSVVELDDEGMFYYTGQFHASADVEDLISGLDPSEILWQIKDASGIPRAAVYLNETTGFYDMAITGQAVSYANFATYSGVGEYWRLSVSGTPVLALKMAGGDLSNGSLLLAGELSPDPDCVPWYHGLIEG